MHIADLPLKGPFGYAKPDRKVAYPAKKKNGCWVMLDLFGNQVHPCQWLGIETLLTTQNNGSIRGSNHE
jgi:hypothetical protein